MQLEIPMQPNFGTKKCCVGTFHKTQSAAFELDLPVSWILESYWLMVQKSGTTSNVSQTRRKQWEEKKLPFPQLVSWASELSPVCCWFFLKSRQREENKTKEPSGWKGHHETPKLYSERWGNTKINGPNYLISKQKTWLLEEIRTIFIWDIWSRANRGNEMDFFHQQGPLTWWWDSGLCELHSLKLAQKITWKRWHRKKEEDHLPNINFQIQTVSLEGGVTWSTKLIPP